MIYQLNPFEKTHNSSIPSNQPHSTLEQLKNQIISLQSLLRIEKEQRISQNLYLAQQIQYLKTKNLHQLLPTTQTSTTSIPQYFSQKQQLNHQQKVQDIQHIHPSYQLSQPLSDNKLNRFETDLLLNNFKQDFPVLVKEFSGFQNDTKLQIAILKDDFTEISTGFQQYINSIGSKENIKNLTNSVIQFQQRSLFLLNFTQKMKLQFQVVNQNIDFLTQRVSQLQNRISEEVDGLSTNIRSSKHQLDNNLNELAQFLQKKLSKVIESYNLNFEDVDKSINQIKQAVFDVIKIHKVMKSKIGQKLNNVIDNQTFHKTIKEISQNLQQTYTLNNQKIKQIHKRDSLVEHQLHQMRVSLDGLQSDFGYTHNNYRPDFQYQPNNPQFKVFSFEEQISTSTSQNKAAFFRHSGVFKNVVNQPGKKQGRYRTQNDDSWNHNNFIQHRASLAQQLQQFQTNQL